MPKAEQQTLKKAGRPKGVAEPHGRSKRGGTVADRLEHWTIPEPNSGCLLWFGRANKQGYPWITLEGKSRRGNRAVWQHYYGPIPPGAHVLHKCDVAACVNHLHLKIGTNADNVADKMAKGRHRCARGSRHGNAKLDEEKVKIIRASDLSDTEMGNRLGVSRALIGMVRRRAIWRHVA